MAEKPLTKTIAHFVKFHLGDKHAFGGFTGTDYRAWDVFVHALRMHAHGDHNAVEILRACVRSAQQRDDVLACFKKAIPGVTDWGVEPLLWAEIAPAVKPGGFLATLHYANEVGGIAWPWPDGPRECSHINSKPSKKHEGWFQCKDPLCKATWKLDDGGSLTGPAA